MNLSGERLPTLAAAIAGIETGAFDGCGFKALFAGSTLEMRAALAESEEAGHPVSLAIMPLGRGEWEELARFTAERFPKLNYIFETDGSAEVPSAITPDHYVALEGPLTANVAASLARHFAARKTSRRGDSEVGDARRLDTLYAIVEKLHGERCFEEGLAAAMSEMARFLRARTASLMVLEDPVTLKVVEALGPNRQKIIGQRMHLSQSRVAKYAIASGEPILVSDMRDDARFGESATEMRYRSRSVLSVPILSKDGPMAVVNLGGDATNATFTERDRDLVVTLSRQIAIALEKNRLFEHLKIAVSGSIRALANAIEAKDPYTKGHSDRVTHYAVLTATVLGMNEQEIEVLKQASILHDVGKIGIPGGVLHKPGRLDELEYRIIQRHPDIGISIVRQIGAMDMTLPIIQAHHERFDGKGYPNGIAGDDIPLGARIVAVADTFDAMTSNRPYRNGLTIQRAVEEIINCAGSQFDRKVAEAFAENVYAWPSQAEESVDIPGSL